MSVLPSGDRSLILHGSGPVGTNVVLEYATNLTNPNWTPLTFFTLPGQVEDAYDVFNNHPTCLYRLNALGTIFTNTMLRGVIRYAGTLPNPTNVSYVGIDGTPYTAYGAYPGWLELFADPFASTSDITDSIASYGGTVSSAMPAAGLYWVQVTNGTEATFLSNIFNEYWILDGAPAFASLRGYSVAMDWNDPADTNHCGALPYGYYASSLAGSLCRSFRLYLGRCA